MTWITFQMNLKMINQEYLDLLKKEGLAQIPSQRARGLFFGFLITFKEDFPELKDYLLDDEEHRAIFPYEDFQVYQIKLCKTNTDTLKMELKVPFLGNSVEGEYEMFLNLLGNYNINSKGHLNLQLEYSIFDKSSKVDKDAFNVAKAALGKDFDLNKMAIVISNYYESTQYAMKLANYLNGQSFVQDFKSYV